MACAGRRAMVSPCHSIDPFEGAASPAMAFSVVVEMLNLKLRSKGKAVKLHEPHLPEAAKA